MTPAFSPWSEATATGATAPQLGAPLASNVPLGAANQFVSIDATSQVKLWVTNSGANTLNATNDDWSTGWAMVTN